MHIAIAAPSNGTELKDTFEVCLQTDPRVSRLTGLPTPNGTYPQLPFAAAQEVAAGRADHVILICGTGVGTAIATGKVRGIHAATTHDLVTVYGSVENYNVQVLCMRRNVITVPAAWILAGIWFDLRRDIGNDYAPKVGEVDASERGA